MNSCTYLGFLLVVHLYTTSLLCPSCSALPESTKWSVHHTLNSQKTSSIDWFQATLWNGTTIRATLKCSPSVADEEQSFNIAIRWMIRNTPCSGNYAMLSENYTRALIDNPRNLISNEPYVSYASEAEESKFFEASCNQDIDLLNGDGLVPLHRQMVGSANPKTLKQSFSNTGLDDSKQQPDEVNVLGQTWVSGPTIFIVEIYVTQIPNSKDRNLEAEITLDVAFKSKSGYLSAIDKPLLKFYAIMCAVYSLYALVWTVFCFSHWRDLLRLQYWICAVIGLGLIEKAVFLAEFDHMNKHGDILQGVELFAEVVSIIKRTLARVLVLIVSLGYGIVRPRLGDIMRKVLVLAFLFLILASVEAAMRIYRSRDSRTDSEMLAVICLSTIDAVICFWVASSLLQTLKNLKLRRNVVKLTLYRHFFNILVLCIMAALAYLIWSFVNIKLPDCFKDWQELWVDTAYWHILFSVVLFGIIILWRPSQNNQRYAFSPLMDKPDDALSDDEDYLTSGGLIGLTGTESGEGQKQAHIRSIYKSSYNAALANKNKSEEANEDENLKWVEEHIPTSGFDSAIDPATTLDSDEEEKLKTQQTIGKML
ncbi:transmembrane protein 87A-like isoform X2 [Symsagittifera roscoffensis]|uniref:transmembrane protein 87A-like isoform X2 n=1 Tax=Symsagittifera roscoffensis TaxID=84072 RepID=UPI00307B29BC